MVSVILNIDYNILYFFELPSKSIISLFFGELSNIDYFFTFLGIDSQSWAGAVVSKISRNFIARCGDF